MMKEVEPLTNSKDPTVKLKAVDTYINLLKFSLVLLEAVRAESEAMKGEHKQGNPLARRVTVD